MSIFSSSVGVAENIRAPRNVAVRIPENFARWPEVMQRRYLDALSMREGVTSRAAR